MEQLLPWVEQELRQFRRRSREFGRRYPRLAGQLTTGHDAGERVGERAAARDPHVDRLIQAVAVLHARIAHSLDRASPLLDETLLESLFPGLLRPFPSSAVFRLSADAPCGTVLQARGPDGHCCLFRLTAAAGGTGLRVAELLWRLYAGPDQVHLLSLTLAGPVLGYMDAQGLRLYVNAEPVLRAALHDAFLMRARSAWVETAGGAPVALHELPLRLAGLREVGEHGWEVLRAYQCFPERYSFLELDLAALRRHLQPGGERLTLHVAVPVRADSNVARALARAEAANLLTGCAPAVNLFAAPAAPIDVTRRASEYGLAAADPAHIIWSIDSVHLQREGVVQPLRPSGEARYGATEPPSTWTARHALPDEAGAPMRMTFSLAAEGEDAGGDGLATASVDLTCCNRTVPAGFVTVEPSASVVSAVSRLCEVQGGRALRRQLLAMLALEARPPDLESLRLALSLQDLAGSDSARKLPAALAALDIVPVTLAMRHKHGTARVDGTEVRVAIDERALVGASVAVFAHVIDQCLSHSVHLNSFMQLVAISAETGEELMRCRPRNGNLML